MSKLADRLLDVIQKATNGDKKEFSRRTQIPYSTLVEYCSGVKNDPKLSFINKILVTFDVDAFWLITGIHSKTHTHSGDQDDKSLVSEDDVVYLTPTSEHVDALKTVQIVVSEHPEQYQSYEKIEALINRLFEENIRQRQKILQMYENRDKLVDLLVKKKL